MTTGPAGRFGFSVPVFLGGLGVVALFYALLAGWLWFEAPKTLLRQQTARKIYTAAIQAPVSSVSPPAGSRAVSPAAVSQPVPGVLPPAPLTGLYEDTPNGRLPIVRAVDGMTPFKAYRRPFNRAATKGPIISIVVADLGLSAPAQRAAIGDLPPDVSLDVSPYADAPTDVINAARARGHEAWLTLPLESSSYPRIDTGADTLLIGASVQQNQNKLLRILGRGAGYAGVMTTADPAFLKSAGDMQPVVTTLFNRGLGLADTSDDPNPQIATMALPKNAPYATASIWLDNTATPAAIRAALAQLEQQAKTKGSATAIIHPLPVSLHEVAAWAATLPAKGITLAPLSAQTGL